MTTLEAQHISHEYGTGPTRLQALTDVSFTACGGELVAVVGPSGCGKSTLLGIVGQVMVPTEGRLLVDGAAVSSKDDARTRARNERFGYLFQDFALVEQDTALDNVQVPLRYRRARMAGRERLERARAALDRVGVADCANRPVRLLSGGQRQRVALARALVNDAPILLADEPTGALDTANGEVVFSLLKEQAAHGRLVLVVTHNVDMALACDRIIALRDGRLVDAADAMPRRALRR